MPDPRLERALGGSPLSVVVKLIFLSLIVGAIMAFLGLTCVPITAMSFADFTAAADGLTIGDVAFYQRFQ